jgi:hypothetical protein
VPVQLPKDQLQIARSPIQKWISAVAPAIVQLGRYVYNRKLINAFTGIRLDLNSCSGNVASFVEPKIPVSYSQRPTSRPCLVPFKSNLQTYYSSPKFAMLLTSHPRLGLWRWCLPFRFPVYVNPQCLRPVGDSIFFIFVSSYPNLINITRILIQRSINFCKEG